MWRYAHVRTPVKPRRNEPYPRRYRRDTGYILLPHVNNSLRPLRRMKCWYSRGVCTSVSWQHVLTWFPTMEFIISFLGTMDFFTRACPLPPSPTLALKKSRTSSSRDRGSLNPREKDSARFNPAHVNVTRNRQLDILSATSSSDILIRCEIFKL